jgi:peptidoglycan hydrolase-like protein with peptidoglycan-binding domain
MRAQVTRLSNHADGDCGPETRQAVNSFQMHNGIVADGTCAPLTEAALRKELAAL